MATTFEENVKDLTEVIESVQELEAGDPAKVTKDNDGTTYTAEHKKDGTYSLKVEGSSSNNLKLAYRQAKGTWNVEVDSDANNEFGFYKQIPDAYTDEAVFSVASSGTTNLKMGTGNDTIWGISLAGNNSTIDGGEGTNRYMYENDDGNEGEATGINIIDGRGSSTAQVTGTYSASMGEGADTVEVLNKIQGTVAWMDYNATEKDAVLLDRADLDVTDIEKLEPVLNTDGTIVVAKNSNGTDKITVAIGDDDETNYHVLLQNVNANGKTEESNIYFAGKKASVMDASAADHQVFMVSNNNENEGDTLYGGAKGDIIVAGENDKVAGGVGDDTIFLGSSIMATKNDGLNEAKRETVILETRGDKDTVYNFGVGTADTSDVVEIGQNGYYSLKSITSDGTDITLTVADDSSLTLKNVGQNQTSHMQNILVSDGDKEKSVGVVQTGQTGYVYDDIYDIYTGSNSALDFEKYRGVAFNLVVDLGNTGRFGDTVPEFYGINMVTGMNSDNNTLVGAVGANNTLVAGVNSYHNSIWGGGQGRDYMKADDGAVDTIFYGSGDDMDTVVGFNTSEDVLYVHSGKVTSTSRRQSDADYIRFTWDNDVNNVFTVNANSKDADTALVYTLDGKTNHGIKVGITDTQNTFNYEDGVDAYFGGEKGDTLKVATSDKKSLWLDGRTGDINTKGITTLDASASTGSLQLAGDTASNTIIGGSGLNIIWGGDGSVADTLQGGSGSNQFYFGTGEGNDRITSYNDGDKVLLYNVTTSSIYNAALDGGDMVIDLKDGSKLTIENYAGGGSMSFTLADGTYLYDKDQRTWTKQE